MTMLFILYNFFGLLTVVALVYMNWMDPNLAGFGLARAELARLEAAGCTRLQGFHFGKLMSAEALEAFIRSAVH